MIVDDPLGPGVLVLGDDGTTVKHCADYNNPKHLDRALVLAKCMLYNNRFHKYQHRGESWQECWFDAHRREWRPWIGDYAVNSTENIHPIAFAPLPDTTVYRVAR
jgi:hypothetical protein